MIVNTQICCLPLPVLNRDRWICYHFYQRALHWLTQLQKHITSPNSPWLTFVWSFKTFIKHQLKELKLQILPRKTRMGRLRQGFHFLGVSFEVSRNPQGKIQETKVDIHRRTTRRALDKVIALRNNAEQ